MLKGSNTAVNGGQVLNRLESDLDPDLYDITYVDLSFSDGGSSSPSLYKSPFESFDSEAPHSQRKAKAASVDEINYSPNVLMGTVIREEGYIYSLAKSGDLLYTGSDSKNIGVYKNHTEFSSFKSTSGLVKAIVVSGDKIFTGHQDGSIRMWKTTSSKDSNANNNNRRGGFGAMTNIRDYIKNSIVPSTYFNFTKRNKISAYGFRHLDAVSCLALSDDKRFLYSGSLDKTFKVWRVSDLRCLETVTGHENGINGVVSCFDSLVYTGSIDGTVKAWRREEGVKDTKHLLTETVLKGDSAVTSIAVDESETLVYCGLTDGTIRFWERENLENGGVLKGHRLAVLCLVSAGDLLFSGSADLGIRVWRKPVNGVVGGEHVCISVLKGHAGPVNCLAVERDQESASGEKRWIVYSGSLDRSVKMWRVSEKSPPMETSRSSGTFGGSTDMSLDSSFSSRASRSQGKK